jgi:hypothetical protein
MSMTEAFKAQMVGGAFGLIAILSTAVWAETPAPADIALEEVYLDLLPKVEVSENVEPIPGAVNEEFRNCRALWPAEYEQAQSGPEARALRDIYGYVQARNVVATQDCTCAGKVASWRDVETLATALRAELGAQRLTWQHTKMVVGEADRLTAITETMCGGSF